MERTVAGFGPPISPWLCLLKRLAGRCNAPPLVHLAMPSSTQVLPVTKPLVTKPSAGKRTTARTSTQSQRVRNKFFQTIGIGLNPPKAVAAQKSLRDIRSVPRYFESLRYDRKEEKMRESRRTVVSSVADENTPSPLRRRVTFEDTVTIVPIPMFTEYSGRVKSKLWCDTVEVSENAGKICIKL